MKLTLAIALILAELGIGVLLMLPLIPISEVRKSFFSFHSMLAAICFALAAGVHQFEMNSTLFAAGLAAAAAICVASFGTAHMAKPTATRILHAGAALMAVVFGLIAPMFSIGVPIAAATAVEAVHRIVCSLWVTNLLLGALLLGTTHDAMGLGHWYLVSRHLSFSHLIRITRILLAVLGIRAAFLILVLVALPHIAPAYAQPYLSQLFSTSGNLAFFLMRILWGLALPFVLAFMSWRCAIGKANQAATGLLYLCEVSVLFGELFAAYLMV